MLHQKEEIIRIYTKQLNKNQKPETTLGTMLDPVQRNNQSF
jgi:hypothetical protein